ncbi:hypothetical protein HNP99_001271 [Flavobacterium sp. 28A]|uniref:DUF4339 domain-containing protein n=1 Tax=Flavobacterium sp. 28A TaxID=2735895 RepID=UPI00156E201D|nr:DUF4339 domain-containing protein [Flavobacterium sp. 28A]NRT14927.1 hypothetical protein [Flavobacterium sp. 28A]
MRTYYINNGKENGGPFTLSELKNQLIDKSTLIWFEGMDEWKYATEIPELQPLIIPISPTIKTETTPKITTQEEASKKRFRIKKSYYYLGLLFLAIFGAVLILNTIQTNKQKELELLNKETQFSNVKIEIQQKESNEDKIQREIQKRIQSQNDAKRKRDSITLRIEEVKTLITQNKATLATINKDLENAKEYKILRSEDSKEEQINILQEKINNSNKTIDKLDNELNRLFLLLETIH